MKNYEDGDNDRNKDGNYDDNTTSGSVSDCPVFDLVTTPWLCGEGSSKDGNGHYVIGALYIHHFKDVS